MKNIIEKPRKSFRTRIFIVFSIVFLLTSVIILYTNYLFQKETILDHTQVDAQNLMEMIVNNSISNILAEDYISLNLQLDSYAALDRVLAIKIFKNDELVIYKQNFVLGSFEEKLYRERQGRKIYTGKSDEAGNYIKIEYPVKSISYSDYTCELIYSIEEDYRRINKLLFYLIRIWIVLFLFGVILIFITSSGVSKPLEKVKDAILAVKKGDRDIRIDYTRNDEVGIVIKSFNDMVNKLRSMEKELEENAKFSTLFNFSSQFVHRIKNNILEISQFLENLETSHIEDENLKTMAKNLNERTINNIKFFSSISKTLSFNLENIQKVNPVLIIEEVFRSLTYHLNKKNIDYRIIILSDIPEILVDGDSLYEIIYNVIQNSMYAVDKNGEIYIKIKRISDDYLKIDVLDNGVGIEEQNVEKVFDPFFTTKKNGIGLGLSISKVLLKKMKGDIKINSNKGEGTQVSILLPINIKEEFEIISEYEW